MTKKTFSLTELLIVIVVILILSSLLMPALKHCVQQTETLTCLANMKAIGNAHQLYINDTSYVVPAEMRNESIWSGTWVRWAGTFVGLEYLPTTTVPEKSKVNGAWVMNEPFKGTSVLKCPSGLDDDFRTKPIDDKDPATLRAQKHQVLGEKWSKADKLTVHVWYGNNGCSGISNYPNWRIAPDNDKKNKNCYSSINRIIVPAMTVSNFDGGGATNNNSNDLSRRHNNGERINLLFWDAHAESVESRDVPPPGAFSWSNSNLNQWNPDIKWRTDQ